MPSTLGYILQDQSILGNIPLLRDEDEKFDEDLRKGRIVAETL